MARGSEGRPRAVRACLGGHAETSGVTAQHPSVALMPISFEKYCSDRMQDRSTLSEHPLQVTVSCPKPHSLCLWLWEIIQAGLLWLLSRIFLEEL